MWRVGSGRLTIKVDECRDDTPKAIKELIAQCTLFDRTQRPEFSPEVCPLEVHISSMSL